MNTALSEILRTRQQVYQEARPFLHQKHELIRQEIARIICDHGAYYGMIIDMLKIAMRRFPILRLHP
jgi:hypothetical protein